MLQFTFFPIFNFGPRNNKIAFLTLQIVFRQSNILIFLIALCVPPYCTQAKSACPDVYVVV